MRLLLFVIIELLVLTIVKSNDVHQLQRGIYQSILYGDVKYMSEESVRNAERDYPTSMHLALLARHEFSGRGVMSDHIELLRYLVDDMNVDIAKWCPLVDAFHYRDFAAIEFIVSRSTDEQLRNCILEKDAFGDNLLHVATRNKVSGLSRLIVLILRRKMYDEEKTNALLKSLGVDWTRTSETSSVRASSILNTLNSETNIKRLLLESHRLMGDGISSFTNELNGCGLSAVRHCSSYSRLVDNEKKIIHTLRFTLHVKTVELMSWICYEISVMPIWIFVMRSAVLVLILFVS